MTACPHCGAEVPEGASVCPACSQPITTAEATEEAAQPNAAGEAAPEDGATVGATAPKKASKPAKPPKPPKPARVKRWSASDILGGVPFLLGGAVLFVAYMVRFFQTVGPAAQVLGDLSSIGGFGALSGIADIRFYYAPPVLEALANLMWCLAGLLLMVAGLLSLFRGRGVSQAGAAVTFMFLGFFANILILFILEGDALYVTGQQMQVNWTPFIIQALIIVVCLILTRLKVRAKKKLTVENAVVLGRITVTEVPAKGGKAKKEKKAKAPKAEKKKKK